MNSLRSLFTGALFLVLLASSGLAETITIYAVPNKTVIGFGEELQLDIYAKLDPGIGGKVLWYPPSGDPPELSEVAALAQAGCEMRITGNTVKEWIDFKKNPQLQYQFVPPILSPKGMLGLALVNFQGKYVATDNWLVSTKLVFKDAVLGFVTLFDPSIALPPFGGVALTVPGEPPLQWQNWLTVTTPLVIQIVPAPGTLGLVASVGLVLCRRKR